MSGEHVRLRGRGAVADFFGGQDQHVGVSEDGEGPTRIAERAVDERVSWPRVGQPKECSRTLDRSARLVDGRRQVCTRAQNLTRTRDLC